MHTDDSIADRSIDLDSVRPVALDGGTAILAQTHRRTPNGARIDAGEIPVAVAGVYSPTDLRRSLRASGFDAASISRATDHQLKGSNATRAVALAEQQAGQVEVLA